MKHTATSLVIIYLFLQEECGSSDRLCCVNFVLQVSSGVYDELPEGMMHQQAVSLVAIMLAVEEYSCEVVKATSGPAQSCTTMSLVHNECNESQSHCKVLNHTVHADRDDFQIS